MAKYTDNCNLILPEQNENYDVGVANTNNREIDFQLGNKVNKIPGKDLSTNDFTNEYKSKIDNLQKIYKFKGNVDTYSDLNNISANNGDIYNVLDEAKNYAWNGTEWVQLGFVIDMSEFAYREEVPTKNSELENDSNFVNDESLEAVSVPTGGTKGQILEKKSNEDNDVGWVDQINVTDNLESDSETDALSAKQGKILNENLSKIIESGSNANGDYIKYANGTMICTKKVTGTADITEQYYGNFYHTPDDKYFDLGNYAQEFIEVPILNVTFYGGNAQWIGAMQNLGTLHIAELHLIAPNSKSAGAYYNVIAIGRWK